MKKWTFLAVAGLLAGAAPVFTGCIDNDEPEGISILRGAKAELLKAKAVVEQANAQWVLAQAAYAQAEANYKNAQAEYEKQRAESFRLQNELKAAQNEEEMERLKAKIEETRQKMEETALKHETEMIKLQQIKEETQRNYELLQKEIEIAKALGSAEQRVTIEQLQAKVDQAYAIMYGGSYYVLSLKKTTTTTRSGEVADDESEEATTTTTTKYVKEWFTVYADKDEYDAAVKAAGADAEKLAHISLALDTKLYEANKALTEAIYEKAKGNQFNSEKDGKSYIPLLEANVEIEKYKVSVAEDNLKAMQEFLSADVEGTDWKAELEALDTKIAGLNDQLAEKNAELAGQKASSEYVTAWQGYYGAYDLEEYNKNNTLAKIKVGDELNDTQLGNLKNYLIKNGAIQNQEEALAKLEDVTEGKFTTEKLTIKASEKIAVDAAIIHLASQLNLNNIKSEIGYPEIKDYSYQGLKYEDVKEGELPAVVQTEVDNIEDVLDDVKELTVDENEVASQQMQLKKLQVEEEELAEDAEAAFNAYLIALDAYSGKFVDVKTINDNGAFKSVTEKYNSLYEALSSAISDYNGTYDAVYKELYDKYYAIEVAKLEDDYLDETLDSQADVLKNVQNADKLSSNAFDNIQASWNNQAIQNETVMTTLVKAEVDKTSLTDAEKTKLTSDVVTAIYAWVDFLMSSPNVEETLKSNTLANADFETAWNTEKTDANKGRVKAKENAIAKANGDIVKFVVTDKSLETAITAYEKVAASYIYKYDDKKKPTAQTLVATYKNNTYEDIKTPFYAQDAKTEKYSVLNTKIEEAEVTAATTGALVKDETKAATAYIDASKAAFGDLTKIGLSLWVGTTAPTADYLQGKLDIYNEKNGTRESWDFIGGAYPTLYDKQDEIAVAEGIINAQESIDALVVAVTKLQSDLDAAIQTNFDKAFGEEVKALEEAETALAEAKDALDKADLALVDIEAEISKLQAQISGEQSVYNALKDAVFAGVTWPKDENNTVVDPTVVTDAAAFIAKVEEAIVYQGKVIAQAKQKLAEAEVELQKAQEGLYDDVAIASRVVAQAQAEFDLASEKYNTALANLNTALKIMADNAAE